MRCNAWVLDRNLKKTTKHWHLANGTWTAQEAIEYADRLGKAVPKEARSSTPHRCGGRLLVEVDAHDEPYMGGTYAQLEVAVTCELCGSEFHPGRQVPNIININNWLQSILDKMK